MSKAQIDDTPRPQGDPVSGDLQRQVFDQMRQIKALQAQIEELKMASLLRGGRAAGSPEAQDGTIAALQKALEDQKARGTDLEGELETLRTTSAAREREMAELQVAIAERDRQFALGADASAHLTKQVDEAKAANAKAAQERDAAIAATETARAQLSTECDALRESQMSLQREIAQRQASILDRDKQIALGVEESARLAKQIDEANAANAKLIIERDAALQSLESSRNQWSAEREELSRNESDLRSQVASGTKALDDAKVLAEKTKADYEVGRVESDNRLSELSDKLAQAESQIGALQSALSDKTHQCSELARQLSLRETTLMRRIEEMLVEAIRRVEICKELQAELDRLRSSIK